jgi:FlaG/FlaF family flagellin (archaellin)
MTRSAVGRFRRTVSPLIGGICCISLVVGLAPATAGATAGATASAVNGFAQTSDQKQREVEATLSSARRSIDEDPTVRGFKERFGATIKTDSVKPN